MQLLVAGEAQARPGCGAAERVQPHAEPAADGLAHEGGRDAELDIRGRVGRHAVRNKGAACWRTLCSLCRETASAKTAPSFARSQLAESHNSAKTAPMPPRRATERDAQPLPGGYKVGDKVFYTWSNHTFADGDKLVHGQQGEVTGPFTDEDGDTRVKVLFPGNKGVVGCSPTEVRRLRAASAATPPACAPHTRRCPRPVRPRDSLCRGAPQPSHCMRSRSHRGPLPGCAPMTA